MIMRKQSIPGHFSPPMQPGYEASYKCTYKVSCLQYEKGQIQVFFHTLVWGILLWLPQETIKLLPRSVHSRLTINISKALGQSNFKAHVGENFPKERTGDTKSSLYSDKSRQFGGRQSCAPKSYYWVYYKQGTVCGVACTQLRSNLLSTR